MNQLEISGISLTLLIWSLTVTEGAIRALPTFDKLNDFSNREVFTSIFPENEKFSKEQMCAVCLLKPKSSTRGNDWALEMKKLTFDQVKKPEDSDAQIFIKKLLVENIVDSAIAICCNGGVSSGIKLQKQDDGDIDVEPNVALTGVSSILQNLLVGNLIGVIGSSINIGSPEWADSITSPMSEVFQRFMGNVLSTIQFLTPTTPPPNQVAVGGAPGAVRPVTGTRPVVGTKPVAVGTRPIVGTRPVVGTRPAIGTKPAVGSSNTATDVLPAYGTINTATYPVSDIHAPVKGTVIGSATYPS